MDFLKSDETSVQNSLLDNFKCLCVESTKSAGVGGVIKNSKLLRMFLTHIFLSEILISDETLEIRHILWLSRSTCKQPNTQKPNWEDKSLCSLEMVRLKIAATKW